MKNCILAIDFDGTCVTHEYPKVGRDIGAEPVLKELVAAGHRLILWTMRSSGREDGSDPLADAVRWFQERDIPLWGIGSNPEQSAWTQSRKAYAHLYIDDAALGCPLVPGCEGERDYVDWPKVRVMLRTMGLIDRPDEEMVDEVVAQLEGKLSVVHLIRGGDGKSEAAA